MTDGLQKEKGQVLQEMGAVILGTVGFLLYMIYDVNSVLWKYGLLQKFFAAGSLCVAGSAVWALWTTQIAQPVFFVGAFLFLFLLIYTLFFALPFSETYLEESKRRLAYMEGVYSLCRHPGVLWFAGVYLCLWGVSGKVLWGIYFISMILWDYLYVVFQDLWTFPKTFVNYEEYKKQTPFLLPNRESIRAYLAWSKRRRQSRRI